MGLKSIVLTGLLITTCGCAGSSYTIQPLSIPATSINKVCVIDNPSLPDEVQGLVNRTVNQKNGVAAFPISAPSVANEIGCQIYMTYGGATTTDIVSFMTAFNVAIYETSSHTRVASASGKVPNNLRLDKWEASKALIVEMVANVMSN
tara:strand:- start:314 stop:757 length:444 start_codon:yes stop_codon:yes gene_type:complete